MKNPDSGNEPENLAHAPTKMGGSERTDTVMSGTQVVDAGVSVGLARRRPRWLWVVVSVVVVVALVVGGVWWGVVSAQSRARQVAFGEAVQGFADQLVESVGVLAVVDVQVGFAELVVGSEGVVLPVVDAAQSGAAQSGVQSGGVVQSGVQSDAAQSGVQLGVDVLEAAVAARDELLGFVPTDFGVVFTVAGVAQSAQSGVAQSAQSGVGQSGVGDVSQSGVGVPVLGVVAPQWVSLLEADVFQSAQSAQSGAQSGEFAQSGAQSGGGVWLVADVSGVDVGVMTVEATEVVVAETAVLAGLTSRVLAAGDVLESAALEAVYDVQLGRHTEAVTVLEDSIEAAKETLKSSKGKVLKKATRTSLSEAVDAAQSVLEANREFAEYPDWEGVKVQAVELEEAVPSLEESVRTVKDSVKAKEKADREAEAARQAEAAREAQVARQGSGGWSGGSSSSGGGSSSSGGSSSGGSSSGGWDGSGVPPGGWKPGYKPVGNCTEGSTSTSSFGTTTRCVGGVWVDIP